MSQTVQDKRLAFTNQKDAPRRWALVVQAPFRNLTCAQFQAQMATWNLIKQTAITNSLPKSQVVKDAVNRMIADIGSWDTNVNCRYILYAHTGNRGVAVVAVNGHEMAGHATLRYCLSDGSHRGIGKCLIEETVNVSSRGGKDGKVFLVAETPFLENLYADYGFITVQAANTWSGAQMTLNPKGQGMDTRWFFTGSRWYFCPV
jgi:hypothetical protein